MKLLSLVFLILAINFSIQAQLNEEILKKFERRSFTHDSTELNYRFFIPENYDSSKSYPLILTLHGAGERGDDNEMQIKLHGLATAWADSLAQKRNPCFILSPQCPKDNRWVDFDWEKAYYNQDTVIISGELQTVYKLLNSITEQYSINKNRIYITGLSMGGYGTWDFITRYPDLFAAAVPMSGGGDASKAPLIKDMPIWVFHGALDKAVPVEGSRRMVNALKNLGSNVLYTELESGKHVIWKELYENRLLQDWLFAQSKK